MSRSDHDMESTYSLPPSIETEIRDDMSTRTVAHSDDMSTRTIPRSENAHQSSAAADLTNKIERQRPIAENKLRQQEIRQTRQLETVRQEAVAELHSATQPITESTRTEATSATAYVANLTKNALNRLNKESQELHQMAANDERLDARPRQMITARKNQLRNQAKEQESPQRAKPKAKSEPFKFNKETMGVKDDEVKDASDDENPETTHTSKGKKGRPSNI